MSPLERMLLVAILFLSVLRVFLFMLEGHPAVTGRQGGGVSDGGGTRDGGYHYDPASFTRDGIPATLSLRPDGRIPEELNLTDTQKAYVYAAMVTTYAGVLERAIEECPRDVHGAIRRWQQRFARTTADARDVLAELVPGRDMRAAEAHKALTSKQFQDAICPSVERYLAAGDYDPHPEAVDRLGWAARSAAPR